MNDVIEIGFPDEDDSNEHIEPTIRDWEEYLRSHTCDDDWQSQYYNDRDYSEE